MLVMEANASSSGGLQKSHKTWATLYSKSQSLVSSLLVNLLISLSRLWHWLQHLWVSEEIVNQQQVAKNRQTKALDSSSENLDFNELAKKDIVAEVDIAISSSTEPEDKMTVEVFAFADTAVNPDQEHHHQEEEVRLQKYQQSMPMPITLRLNSQSLDHEDEDILLEFNGDDASQIPNSQADQDSCSGYCSGSGSSLPGSPTPNSNIKEHLSSSDEHEIDGESPAAALPLRRDSDTSDSSETNVEVSPEVVSRIVAQVEAMFSDDHLAKDGFLLKHVRRRSDGFVSLKLVAGLRKVKQISREFSVVLNAIKTSSKLEVNTEGTKVRRVEPLTTALKSMPIKQAKKDKSQTDKEQAEKENQVGNQHHNSGTTGNGNHSMTDEQQIAQKRRQKGDRLNELHYERGQHFNKNYNYNSGRSSISDETPQVIRRRGGSLPIPPSLSQKRGSTAGNYLYPNASPPNGSAGFLRPKSNSYSEGTDPSAATMSSWLQKRKASAASSRLSNGDISLNGAIRQPRGPDGTKGFH